MAAQIVLSLGSNVEPCRTWIEKAVERLSAFPQTVLTAVGDIIETEPVDVPDEFRSMTFLNLVILAETTLEPRAFSDLMHGVEDDLGRVRTIRNGPRTIDIDIIDFDGLRSDDPALTLPHPRAMERAFVTEPWKRLVRRTMREKRSAVPSNVRAAKSAELCGKLTGLLDGVRLVCCYEALPTELDLDAFVDHCQRNGIDVVFPRPTDNNPALPPGRRSYAVERSNEVDLWICPGLAFTREGARIGFGGGWYDRFLTTAKPTARAYGVGYDFQICRALPQNPWDKPLAGVVTV